MDVMASDNDGPDFSYAYGGAPAASWNPALRPDAERDLSPKPEATPTAAPTIPEASREPSIKPLSSQSYVGEDDSAQAARVPDNNLASDADTASDEDFFERYGSSAPPVTPLSSVEQARDSAAEKGTSLDAHVPQAEDAEDAPLAQLIGAPIHDARETTEQADAEALNLSSQQTEMHTLSDLEPTDATDEPHGPSDGYEFQGDSNFLEDAIEEDASMPLVNRTNTGSVKLDDLDDLIQDKQEGAAGEDHGLEQPAVSLDTTGQQASQVVTEGPMTGGPQERQFEMEGAAAQEPDIDWGTADEAGFDFGAGATNILHDEAATSGGQAEVEKKLDQAFAEEGHQPVQEPKDADLAAMWDAALGDDDLLNEDEELDHTSLFGDDNEGFLEDLDEGFARNTVGQDAVGMVDSTLKSPSKYAPVLPQQQVQSPQNLYRPQGPQFTDLARAEPSPGMSSNTINPYDAYTRNPAYAASYRQQQPVRPAAPSSTQSFVDKSKGGYSSPYDLPEDLAKPKRRPHIPPAAARPSQPTPPPPRSSSIAGTFVGGAPRPLPPSNMSAASLSPPSSSHSVQSPTQSFGANGAASRPQQPPPKSASSEFFADLPVVTKPRQSRPSGMYTPQQATPVQPPPFQPPQTRSVPPAPLAHAHAPPLVAQLQQPERLPPFPSQPALNRSVTMPAPAAPVPPRYSPAPPAAPLPTANARYSPLPTAAPASGPRYSPAPASSAPPTAGQGRYASVPGGPPKPQVQSYAPRTSSPLAAPHNVPSEQQQRAQIPRSLSGPQISTQQFPRMTSLPIVPESDLFQPEQIAQEAVYAQQIQNQQQAGSYMDAQLTAYPENSATPPPPRSGPSSAVSSPQKRLQSNYAPQHQTAPPISDPTFVPPRRSRTQSPGAVMKNPRLAITSIERPATSHAPISPTSGTANRNISTALPHRRGFSQEMNFITPTDERAADPLERWKGNPIFKWGLGGTVLTTFPKLVPRYGAGHVGPMIRCSPGEVKLQSIKDLCPLDEKVASFPGPLRAKGKKKDVITWLRTQIEIMEKDIQAAHSTRGALSDVPPPSEEKLLLWKVMLVLVEHDGMLEGTSAVDQAARKVLSPDLQENSEPPLAYATGSGVIGKPSSLPAQAEPVDPQAVLELRKHLVAGDREKAIWHAVDQRLWAHALLISSTLDRTIWKQVVQEFVRKEVKKVGAGNEALATLYEIFGGNWEDCIDELVPASARAGFQMIGTDGMGATKNALEGLDRWRETLSLILSNRSTGDAQALLALGRLLASYGRVEAAHICYLFARSVAYLGGADDPQSNFTLIGADHISQPFDFGRDIESILLSEVYEFAMTVLASPAAPPVTHLQSYKLYHAYVLAEHGHRTEAQQYCDAIGATMSSKTAPSRYYHVELVRQLDDLSRRLSQSPKDGSSSWISKPSMTKVSGTLGGMFTRFVAGDEDEGASTGTTNGAGNDVGPFAKIAGDTPTVSRSGSSTDLYGSHNLNGAPAISAAPLTTSKYAPTSAYAPRSSLDQARPRYEPKSSSAYIPGRPSLESTDSSYGRRASSDRTYGASDSPQLLSNLSSSYPTTKHFNPLTQNLQPPQSLNACSQGGPDIPAATSPHAPSPYQPTPPPESAAPISVYSPPQPDPEDVPAEHKYERYVPDALPTTDESSHGPEEPSASKLDLPPTTYEPPTSSYEPPTSGYEPPSYQSYEPEPDAESAESPVEEKKPKKKSFMDDDDDDDLARRAAELKKQQKAQADREADEAFRKAAEADAAKPAPEKKGWFSFGWGKKDPNAAPASGPIKAKLGEENSFVYDPDLKKWVNKKAGATAPTSSAPTPPPPKGPPSRTASSASLAGAVTPSTGAPPPSRPPMGPPLAGGLRGASMPPTSLAGPPSGPPSRSATLADAAAATGADSPALGPTPPTGPGPAAMLRSASGMSSGPASAPPSRPATSMSAASDIDDLLGAPGARKGGTVRGKKKAGRYVDVMGAK